MRIGILGSGLMGGKLGTLFARAGHEVVLSYSRSEKKLERLAREAGRNAQPGTPREAAEGAAVVSAFGTVPSEVLFDVYDARDSARRPSLVYCGDESRAKEIATRLIRD